ncbi:hypothetical protein PSTU1396_05995 [Providencia stuartii]|nr:hypothetical protein PSTU1396_05995 [Providencia stuartii]CAK6610107.1 hypothetical protein PS9952019_05995 [Providencia stuartii]
MKPISVTILTGFLGAGKTTLLRHILQADHGHKIAVIENEFGEVPIDNALIGDRATQITTLSNGCICCSRSNELENALLDLLDGLDSGKLDFDRLVIECTGMADPGPITQTFFLMKCFVNVIYWMALLHWWMRFMQISNLMILR